MKKIFYLFIPIFFFMGFAFLRAQTLDDASGTDVNIPDPADEAAVAGNGTQPGQNNKGFHVNTFTGDAWATVTDFSYHRDGFPMKYERYFHNGITSPFGELGQGWMSNYDICLYVPLPNTNGDHAILVLPHQSWRFATTDGGNTFTAPPGCFYTLQTALTSSLIANAPSNYSTTTYVLTGKNGNKFKFNVIIGGEPNIARLVEMDDLNQNRVVLTYSPFSYFQEAFHFNLINWSDSYGSLELTNVAGKNWSINFSYYTDSNPETTITNYYGNSSSVIVQNSTPCANRLALITDSAGDSLLFDGGNLENVAPNNGPTTQVLRSPSNLNATYQYYTYTANPSGSNPTTVVTLKQVTDPYAPVGYKDITYVSESNPNSMNNQVRQILNNANQIMYTYDYSVDASGNSLCSTSGPNGLIETDVYDSTSRMVQKRFTVDNHPYSEFYTWNLNDQMTNKIDGNGNAVTMNYDSLGNMIYMQDAEGYKQYWTYNNISRLVNSTDKNQVSRSYNYDGNGNLTQVNEPGRQTTYTYDSYGNRTSVTDGNGHTTTYTYDIYGFGNVTSVQQPSVAGKPGATTTYIYDTNDPNGRNLLSSKKDPLLQTTTYTYNSNYFLSEIQYPDTTSVQYFYDPNGNVYQTIDQDNISTISNHDFEGRVYQTIQDSTSPDARTTNYAFDTLGNQLSITDNVGQKTSFVYNEQNLVRTSVDSAGVGATNTFDGALNLISTKDTRGIIKTVNYFKNNRLEYIGFSDGTPSISYTYDGNGNRKSMMDAVGLKSYNYDSLNNLTSISDTARNFTLNYAYDSVGNKLSMQSNKVSGTVYYSHYENNMMKAVTDVDGTVMIYVYDAMKHPANAFYPNGASVTYNYFPTNHRLQSLQNLNSSQELLSSFTCGYDNMGNITGVTDLTGTTTYKYDDFYELNSVTYPSNQNPVSYFYDGVGNRTNIKQTGTQTIGYGYGPGNEMTYESINSFSYDAVGNMVQRGNSSGTTTYTWDGRNQLIKVLNTFTPSTSINFVYDGDGHRVQKKFPKGTINYFYDGSSVVVETDGNGNILKTYNPGISSKDQQGNKLYYLYNGHGDVIALMDGKQSLVQSYVYDAFGSTLGDQKVTYPQSSIQI